MSKKPQGQKQPRPTIAAQTRGYDPETKTLYDKRGLFESTVGPGGCTILKQGKPEPNAADEAGALVATARARVANAHYPQPQTAEAAIDVETWRNTIMAACGPGSPPALAAAFLYNLGIVKADIENAALRPELKFSHIIQFAAAWHALKFEVSGEHELAFGKVQHVAGQKKGTNVAKGYADQRNVIIRTEVERRGGMSGKQISYIARNIRADVDRAFIDAGIAPKDRQADGAFERMVRRALPKV